MKKFSALMFSGLLALSLCGCSSSADTTSETTESDEVSTQSDERTQLVVGFDAEFPPYGYKDGDDYSGFDLDLAQAVCDYYGWELVKQPIDWDSKDMELSSGTIDCIWNGFTINGREDSYTWSTPYIDNSQVVVVRSDSGISSIDDLAGKTMDVQADSSALAALSGEDATDTGKQISDSLSQLIQVADYNTAFMDLESGAVDAIAMDVGVANYQLANRDGDFTILDTEISTEQYGIGFKLGNTELRDQVQSALEQLNEDGKLDQILQEWSEKDNGSYAFLETSWCFGKE